MSKAKYSVPTSSKKRTKYLPNSALPTIIFGKSKNKTTFFRDFLTFRMQAIKVQNKKCQWKKKTGQIATM